MTEQDRDQYANRTLFGVFAESWLVFLVCVDLTGLAGAIALGTMVQVGLVMGSPEYYVEDTDRITRAIEQTLLYLGLYLALVVGVIVGLKQAGQLMSTGAMLETMFNDAIALVNAPVFATISHPLRDIAFVVVLFWSIFQIRCNAHADVYQTQSNWAWFRGIANRISRYIATVDTIRSEQDCSYPEALVTYHTSKSDQP